MIVHYFESIFQSAGQSSPIAQRAGQHQCLQGVAKLFPSLCVAGQGAYNRNVMILAGCRSLRAPKAPDDRRGHSPTDAIVFQGHQWHALSQRVKGRCAAVEGNGIEGDVKDVVQRHEPGKVPARHRRQEKDPVRFTAAIGEQRQDALVTL
jgi:hypothetical protein